MLGCLLGRAGIKHKGVVSSDIGLLYEFNLKGTSMGKCVQTKFTPYTAPVVIPAARGVTKYESGYTCKEDSSSSLMTKADLAVGDTIGFMLKTLRTTQGKNKGDVKGAVEGECMQTVRNSVGTELAINTTAYQVSANLLKELSGMENDAMLCGTIVGSYVARRQAHVQASKTTLQLNVDDLYLVGTVKDWMDGTLDWCVPKVLNAPNKKEAKTADGSPFEGRTEKKHRGAYGECVSREELVRTLSGGCRYCGVVLDADAPDDYQFLPEGTLNSLAPYCVFCAEELKDTYLTNQSDLFEEDEYECH